MEALVELTRWALWMASGPLWVFAKLSNSDSYCVLIGAKRQGYTASTANPLRPLR